MKILIRLLLTGIIIYYSWLETLAPVTTFIIVMLSISLEVINWMLMFVSKQITELHKDIDELLK